MHLGCCPLEEKTDNLSNFRSVLDCVVVIQNNYQVFINDLFHFTQESGENRFQFCSQVFATCELTSSLGTNLWKILTNTSNQITEKGDNISVRLVESVPDSIYIQLGTYLRHSRSLAVTCSRDHSCESPFGNAGQLE